MNTALRKRFEEKFTKPADGCWLWTGAPLSSGYGRIRVGGKTLRAHRVSYALYVGEIPDGLCVLHACDVRLCVRPDHLWIGTRADNVADMINKGRGATGDKSGAHTHPERLARGDRHGSRTHPEQLARGDRHGSRTHPERVMRGEQNGRAKLGEADVLAIRASVGLAQKHLALQFGVRQTLISAILLRQIWKHI